MYSKIILSQTADEEEDGYLQTFEVYNLKLNAELVALSGCNTGLGRLRKGEGLLGMARAFQYAGAKNLLVSLWPVNDKSTAELMRRFYHGMRKGLTKSRALQKAKIEMLVSEQSPGDPFYWGPFVLLAGPN
jgi:CHAT domain-containing protein